LNYLITRRVFAIHPVGFQYLEAGAAGLSPTDAELAAKECWDRIYNEENSPIVCMKHKIA
jgi:hypothetical protein